MYIKPRQLGFASLDPQALRADKEACRKFGPCGVGQKALYLNSFYLDRVYYLPLASVRRVFKRVAMSKGGFSGKGVFGSMPYLVVVYDDGREKQCNFKFEENVDQLLAHLQEKHPEIKTVSAAAEQRLAAKAAARAARPKAVLTEETAAQLDRVEQARTALQPFAAQSIELAAAAKAKRVNERANPAAKWIALVIVLLGVAALIYGVYTLLSHESSGIYFTLLGLAAVFLFSGAHVLPTARNNSRAIAQRLRGAQETMEQTVAGLGGDFPLPGRYAHPEVLARMADAIREGRAQTAEQALELVKADLKAMNASVTLEQEEYDQVVAIKPMFLVEDYR